MDEEIRQLREKAAQCRFQARASAHRPTAAMLEQMSAEYDAAADRMEMQRNVQGQSDGAIINPMPTTLNK